MKEGHREHGTVDDVCESRERGPTLWISLRFKGSGQGFGGYTLHDKLLPAWKAEICELFAVERIDDIVGKRCWALRSFSFHNASIEGLEVRGRRFTATSFFRRHLPKSVDVKSPIVHRRDELMGRISLAARQTEDALRDLRALESDYIDWAAS